MILSRYNIERLIAKGLVANAEILDLRKLINPASLDVTLGCELMVPNGKSEPLKSWLEGNEEYFDWIKLEDGGTFTLQPQQFILAHTAEIFSIPLDICADFCLKSRLGRVGLEHQLAGFIDPGFEGSITLELYNSAALSYRVESRPAYRSTQVQPAGYSAARGRRLLRALSRVQCCFCSCRFN